MAKLTVIQKLKSLTGIELFKVWEHSKKEGYYQPITNQIKSEIDRRASLIPTAKLIYDLDTPNLQILK